MSLQWVDWELDPGVSQTACRWKGAHQESLLVLFCGVVQWREQKLHQTTEHMWEVDLGKGRERATAETGAVEERET